jgi:formylglycine-generating enzyme required for sulfatase activity
VAGSGWDPAWDAELLADAALVSSALECEPTLTTWTRTSGANEGFPLGCTTWFEAFAFCVWDGGRLPTEAEWTYTASGGAEQRHFPWSVPPDSTTVDASYAVHKCIADAGTEDCSAPDIAGSRAPKGDGRWGHADLGGSLWERVFDWYQPYVTPCIDCANLTPSLVRTQRGGSFENSAYDMRNVQRSGGYPPQKRHRGTGFRCARDVPARDG